MTDSSRYTADQPAGNEVLHAARELRYRMLADPHRPGYHFAIPEDNGHPETRTAPSGPTAATT